MVDLKTHTTFVATALAVLVLATTLVPAAAGQSPEALVDSACDEVASVGPPPVPPTGNSVVDNTTMAGAAIVTIFLAATVLICGGIADAVGNPEEACRIVIGDFLGFCAAIVQPLVDFVMALADAGCSFFIEGSIWHAACVMATNPEVLLVIIPFLVAVALELVADLVDLVNGEVVALADFTNQAVVAINQFTVELMGLAMGFIGDRVDAFNGLMSMLIDLVVWLVTTPTGG